MRSLWSIRLVGRIVPYAAMSIVLLLWGFSGMVKIESNQQGALYRLGVLQTEPLEPGLHMTLPWPFDSVEVYDTNSVKQMTVGYISEENADNIWTESHGAEEYRLLLGDGKELVSINMRVEFVIEDLYAYLTNSAAPESLMQAAAYELITEKTIGTDLATLLTADRVAFVKDFEAELVRRAKEYGTGLGIVNIVLESIHPPVEIADIYQEIINSRIEAQQVVTTAEGAAKVTVIQAENNYGATIKDAEAKKIAEIAAEYAKVAEIEGHNAAYEKYGDAYEYYLRINALRDAYSKGQLVIDGSDSLTQEDIKGILIMLGVLSAK
jgi:regulator of protease activity HflC (stomatin/prohibitin superfamily)